MIADQRREGRHGATLGTAEDGAERRGLLFIGALIDIGCKRPVALSHGARRMTNHGNVEPVQRYLAVAALVDVEDERNVAYALARSRRQRRASRDEAWAHHVAVAVLEIIARQLPLLLCRHVFLLFDREKYGQGYDGFALAASASSESPPGRAINVGLGVITGNAHNEPMFSASPDSRHLGHPTAR